MARLTHCPFTTKKTISKCQDIRIVPVHAISAYIKGAYTSPRLKPTANCLYPATPLPLIWPVCRKIALKQSEECQLHNSLHVLRLRDMQALDLSAPPTHCWSCASSTQPIRGQTPQTPKLSDFACWIVPDTVQALPTQLNTRKRFVSKFVRISPNVSDGQQFWNIV